jgi:GTP cyclohydrolase I
MIEWIVQATIIENQQIYNHYSEFLNILQNNGECETIKTTPNRKPDLS